MWIYYNGMAKKNKTMRKNGGTCRMKKQLKNYLKKTRGQKRLRGGDNSGIIRLAKRQIIEAIHKGQNAVEFMKEYFETTAYQLSDNEKNQIKTEINILLSLDNSNDEIDKLYSLRNDPNKFENKFNRMIKTENESKLLDLRTEHAIKLGNISERDDEIVDEPIDNTSKSSGFFSKLKGFSLSPFTRKNRSQ